MAEVLKDGEFWLPPEFLTDDEIFMGKENFNGNEFCFPTQFPYELNNSESDEEDISVLTRQFSRANLQIPLKNSFPSSNKEAKWVYSGGSPQSTLSAAGSWSFSSNGSSTGPSQDPSPPATPFIQVEDTKHLISAAAGQVARMKMNLNNRDGMEENRALIAQHHRSFALLNHNCASHSPCHHNHFQQMRPEPAIGQQLCPIWGKPERERWLLPSPPPPPPPQVNQGRVLRLGVENGRPISCSHSAWLSPYTQNHRQLPPQSNAAAAMNRGAFLGGGGGGVGPAKRECAGTGVFIPRPSESRKKPDLINRNFQPMIYRAKAQAQPSFPDGFIPNYDLLIARRNAAMAQQQQHQQRQSIRAEVMMKHHEVLLPQEWTY